MLYNGRKPKSGLCGLKVGKQDYLGKKRQLVVCSRLIPLVPPMLRQKKLMRISYASIFDHSPKSLLAKYTLSFLGKKQRDFKPSRGYTELL